MIAIRDTGFPAAPLSDSNRALIERAASRVFSASDTVSILVSQWDDALEINIRQGDIMQKIVLWLPIASESAAALADLFGDLRTKVMEEN